MDRTLETRVHRFAALTKQKRDLETSLRAVNQSLDAEQEPLREAFLDAGIQRMNVQGVTLYVHRQLWVGAGDGGQEAACKALRRARLGEFVGERFNSSTVSAYFREKAQAAGLNNAPLEEIVRKVVPKSLRGVLTLDQRILIRGQLDSQ
jgi:hypothetical protein